MEQEEPTHWREGYAQRRTRRRFEAEVRRFLKDEGFLPSGSRLLVAVSGGADSTALLFSLHAIAAKRRIELVVAHLDHGLRGAEVGEADRAFVTQMATGLGLGCVTGRLDVGERARRDRLTIEEAARIERYAFLSRTAHEAGCSAVATGHTASDQAETVLLHVIRGAGLGGLSGMAASSAWPFPGGDGLRLVRPLLSLSRSETVDYCRTCGVEPLQDESNDSPAFRRNRIRHEVLPLLRQLNPRVDEALTRLADAARDDVGYFDSLLGEEVAVVVEEQAIELDRTYLSSLGRTVRPHFLRRSLTSLPGGGQGFTARHVTALDRLATQGRTGDHLDLPRGLVAELKQDTLRIGPERDVERLPNDGVTLPVPGSACFGRLAVCASEQAPRTPEATVVEVDAGAAGESLVVRARIAGDRFQPLGMQQEKKLQDFFTDAHVPRVQRDAVPLFVAERGIVWVGGLRIAEWAKPRPGRPAIYLSYTTTPV